MNTFDVKIEFVNGHSTWTTIVAVDKNDAEMLVSDEYVKMNLHTVWAITAHDHGTCPGLKRQGRRS